MERQAIKPDLDILAREQNISPSEFLVVGVVAISPQSSLNESAFVLGKPRNGIRIIRNEPVRGDSNHNCEKTFKNENPSPTCISADVSHMRNSPSQDSSKSTSQGCRAEEQRDTILTFIALVPH
jgi:hypothetical protein